MVSARSAFGTSRTRYSAGPLRVLWLAALLFTFLYTHAAGAESASAHVTRGAVDVSYLAPADHHDAAEAPDEHDDGNGLSHPAEACASGQPQQGLELPSPQSAPLATLTPAFGRQAAALDPDHSLRSSSFAKFPQFRGAAGIDPGASP